MKVVTKQYLLLLIFFAVFTICLIYLEKNNAKFSLSIDKSKALSAQSVHVLQNLIDENTVKFLVFTRKDSAVGKKIHQFFTPIKQVNPQINIEFIDPTLQPDQVKAHAISMQGEIVLTHQDNSKLGKVNITELSESAVINAILRLQNNKDKAEWIVFAESYGMLSIDDESATGLSQLLLTLKKQGYHVARMPLNISLVLPSNVKLIILPNPQQKFESEMVNWIQQQSQQGISLWWLSDIGSIAQSQLELAVDVMLGDKSEIKPGEFTASIDQFPDNIITENFNQPIYLAQSREIIAPGYQALVKAQAQAQNQDQNQAVLALSKQLPNSRIVINGDSDFISNQYLNVAANQSFAMRIIDWLLYHDNRVNIPVHINQHTQLYLSNAQLIFLSVVFLLLIPLLFLIMAGKQWRANRA
ncbi:MAG: GldG family protein [Proteobacteria bacterium]|nr:GldG family protein [Pseudomonadota bacterium]